MKLMTEIATHNALNPSEFPSKLCLEIILVLPLIKDNLSTMDQQLVTKVSSLRRFHSMLLKLISTNIINKKNIIVILLPL